MREFIASFDGDARRAFVAFRRFAVDEAARIAKPKRPLSNEVVLEVRDLHKLYIIRQAAGQCAQWRITPGSLR